VRRATLIALAIAALVVPVALAAQGEPQKKLTRAGQARARAAALTAADVGPGWKASRTPSNDSRPRCSYYNPDQSDLIEIGDYESPDFNRADGSFVSSSTGVFKSARMARTAYARVAVPPIARCFGELFQKRSRSRTSPPSSPPGRSRYRSTGTARPRSGSSAG
jgi:hypothetical protein